MDLKNLEKWATNWSTRFNDSKCYVITVGKGKKTTYMYELCGTMLQSVIQEKYLGGPDLERPRIKNVASSANQKLGS